MKELGVTMNEIRRGLEEREKIMKKSKRAVEQMKISVQNEVDEHEKSFTDLICCIDETQKKLTERIREQVTREVEKAEGVIEKHKKDMEEQKKRDADLRELSETKEHNCILQSFSSRGVLPADGDSLSITVALNFSFVDLREELSCLKKSLEKISQWEVMTLTSGRDAPIFSIQPPEPRSRAEFLQYFCPLTLDWQTAQKHLFLSKGNKKVTCNKNKKHSSPCNPVNFSKTEQILCSEALTGTRCYWEVKCTGESVKIGVTYKEEDINYDDHQSLLGYNDMSWCLWCLRSLYFACNNEMETVIRSRYSPRIGVYLDWPAGSLSFYSVSHTMTLLHRFNTTFTKPLYPAFHVIHQSSVTICNLMP